MLTVDALPAACNARNTNKTPKLGVELSAMLAIMYTLNEAIYIGRRPMASEKEPHISGVIPWAIM